MVSSTTPPSTEVAAEPAKVWDSPWYWLHLFCVASLVGVLLVSPKFAERQAGVERKFQGRQRAALQKAGKAAETEMATAQNRHVKLLPIYALLGVGAAGSWIALWQTHFRKRRTVDANNAANQQEGPS